jgi:hypothetical protein
MKTLITAGTTARAFALGNEQATSVPVMFGDNPNFPVPSFMKERFITIPPPEKETFIHELLTLCLDHDISKVYPLRKEEQVLLQTASQLFSEFGVEISIILPIL